MKNDVKSLAVFSRNINFAKTFRAIKSYIFDLDERKVAHFFQCFLYA